ncbi:10438_t:CDS:2 [Funneliformis geosporum]|uniref:6508_t:CDS:1 n=1 Tax=Funneliformis geosporum TaxID=1117311 RepID=A0A9W4SWJ3_9GLOM|nr:10438_t:CDS:2 [Funneliformis geosporum]CAI2184153.1 6508_t:CDS:2 [Funneliformis geosporum]
MIEAIDYRVSRVVILCKDCGQDVGLYPARHKCVMPTSEVVPALPAIPKKFQSSSTSSSNTKNFSSSNFKSYNLWNKIMSNAADIYNNSGEDSDNESETDDWDGETHISRILREYYERKGSDLPNWLYDYDSNSNTPNKSFIPQTDHTFIKRQVSTNGGKNVIELNNDRGRQPIPYNNNFINNSFPIPNHSSTRMEGRRIYMNAPPPPNSFNRINNNNTRNVQYHDNIPPLPVSRRLINDRINNNFGQNSLPSGRYQPVSNSEDIYSKRLIPSKTSYQFNSRELQDPRQYSSVKREIRVEVGFNGHNGHHNEHNEHNEHNGHNVYKGGDLRSGQDIPVSGSRYCIFKRIHRNKGISPN